MPIVIAPTTPACSVAPPAASGDGLRKYHLFPPSAWAKIGTRSLQVDPTLGDHPRFLRDDGCALVAPCRSAPRGGLVAQRATSVRSTIRRPSNRLIATLSASPRPLPWPVTKIRAQADTQDLPLGLLHVSQGPGPRHPRTGASDKFALVEKARCGEGLDHGGVQGAPALLDCNKAQPIAAARSRSSSQIIDRCGRCDPLSRVSDRDLSHCGRSARGHPTAMPSGAEQASP